MKVNSASQQSGGLAELGKKNYLLPNSPRNEICMIPVMTSSAGSATLGDTSWATILFQLGLNIRSVLLSLKQQLVILFVDTIWVYFSCFVIRTETKYVSKIVFSCEK